MGGQFEYFGLWLDAEFGKGHCSESCTTYKNYKMLSATKYFEIDCVEVWAVGPEYKRKDMEVRYCKLVFLNRNHCQGILFFQINNTELSP